MQANISEILHNVADHTETFFRFLSEANLSEELKNRLIDHIVLEEQENTSKLQGLHDAAPTAMTQKLLDHSFILQKIMRDGTMPLDLKQELLHHFMEEHTEWQAQLGAGHERAEAPSAGRSEDEDWSAHVRGAGVSHSHERGSSAAPREHGAPREGSARPHNASADHQQSARRYSGTGDHGGAQSHRSQSQDTDSSGWTVGPMWNQGG